MMKYKYQVGDLLTTGVNLYLVEEIRARYYYVIETERQHRTYWRIKDADGDGNLKKVN